MLLDGNNSTSSNLIFDVANQKNTLTTDTYMSVRTDNILKKYRYQTFFIVQTFSVEKLRFA